MDQRIEAGGALALIREAGHQQDRDLRMVARCRQRQRDAVHDRHADVGQQQFEAAALARQHIERLGAVVRGHHRVAVLCERARDQAAHAFLVLGDQNARHGLTSCMSGDAGRGG